MADILKDISKFKILCGVDGFDKTAREEQQIQHELLKFYNDHLITKMINEIIRPVVYFIIKKTFFWESFCLVNYIMYFYH